MNRIPRTDLIVGYQTHPGETGKNNEDRALLMAFQGAAGEKSPVTLAVVADGIGGHQAGEVASQIAVNTFTSLFTKTDSRSYLDLFAQGFATIAQGIVSHTTKNPDAAGMGTTCAAVVIANRRLYTAYIGDSRIYLIRNH
ncbi:MAG: serine/threonine-protein phosphatase, partial [Chloroflexi bacterium]|nr:serine/threonine-protein phosphatase [Chloroflexota bacterium]